MLHTALLPSSFHLGPPLRRCQRSQLACGMIRQRNLTTRGDAKQLQTRLNQAPQFLGHRSRSRNLFPSPSACHQEQSLQSTRMQPRKGNRRMVSADGECENGNVWVGKNEARWNWQSRWPKGKSHQPWHPEETHIPPKVTSSFFLVPSSN